jgi:hypothetical protein
MFRRGSIDGERDADCEMVVAFVPTSTQQKANKNLSDQVALA